MFELEAKLPRPASHPRTLREWIKIAAQETQRGGSLARHPTRQRCLTPSLASQLLQDTAMPPGLPRCSRRPPEKVRLWPRQWLLQRRWGRGRPGRGRWSNTEWKPRGRRWASRAGLRPGAGSSGRRLLASLGLRCPLGGGAHAPSAQQPELRQAALRFRSLCLRASLLWRLLLRMPWAGN